MLINWNWPLGRPVLVVYVILLWGGWVSGVRGEEKNEFVFQKNEID